MASSPGLVGAGASGADGNGANGSGGRLGKPAELNNGSDSFEEIDDPREILSRPLVRSDQNLAPPRSAALSSHKNSGAGRVLPWNAVRMPSASGVSANMSRPLPWSQPKAGRGNNGVNSSKAKQVWDPRARALVPVISGVGARVPTRLLTSGSATSVTDGHANASATGSGPFGRDAAYPVGGSSEVSIDLTEDSDDEPVVTGSSKAPPGRSRDGRPSLQVCIGQLSVPILCYDGLPEHMLYEGEARLPDPDPAYQRFNWPRPNDFWCSRTHRPVGLQLAYGSASAQPGARSQLEVQIRSLLAPTRGPLGSSGPRFDPKPFATLSSKPRECLSPLMAHGKVAFAARCRMEPRASKRNYMHNMQLLLFTTRALAISVGQTITNAGYTLDAPDYYVQSDWENNAEYVNPLSIANLPASKPMLPPLIGTAMSKAEGNFNEAEDYRRQSTFYPATAQSSTSLSTNNPAIYPGSRAQIQQQKELTEEEKRQQVDSVYASLRSGEDLEQIEPCGLIKTQLFPHQKQALGFLLERERERSFDELAVSTDSKTSGNGNGKGKGRVKGETAVYPNPDASDTISLWKVVRNSGRHQATYLNVVTQTEVMEAPHICRGALLADDMGLGKTLQIISLIAHTQDEANSFGKSRLVRVTAGSDVSDSESDSDIDDDDDDDDDDDAAVKLENFSRLMSGAPPAKKVKVVGGSAAKGGIRAAKRRDEERLRRENLITRSRATLIIAPLSIITNWEEQVKEHWSRRNQPKIYIYHGSSRSMDCRKIANHDIVLTTYSTIGTEFSNQRTWTEADSDPDESEDEVMDEVEEIDDDGNTVISLEPRVSAAKERAKAKARKRKDKFATGKEAYNPLQRIEWFRVVLDEAHIIKEAATWQSRATVNLSAQRRISLTGTPIQNRLDDLYAQIKFLRLEPFTDRAVWTRYCGQRKSTGSLTSAAKAKKSKGPSDEVLDAMALARVQLIMKFLTLRRTKNTRTADGKTLLSLPPKLMLVTKLKLNEHEKAKYKVMHQRWKEEMEEMAANDTVSANYATILHEILNLRLTCCHPELVDAGLDKKRIREGEENIAKSISEDGLTRDRAIKLVLLFCESDSATCVICAMDLSAVADLDGRLAATRVDGDVDGIAGDLGVDARDRPIKGLKRRNGREHNGGSGSRTPLSENNDSKSEAVVTRCQHLFCPSCFDSAESIGPRWRTPASRDEGACPACRFQLKLALDVILISEADFRTSDMQLVRRDTSAMLDSDPSTSSDSAFDWDDIKEAKPKIEAGQEIDLSLDARPDMSTKIRALVQDLLQFSRCNPVSRLYDPNAPRLEHTTEPLQVESSEVVKKELSDVKPDIKPDVKSNTKPDVKPNEKPSIPEPRLRVLVTPTAPVPQIDVRGRPMADPTQVIKSVVFSQWTTMLDRIQKSLILTGIGFARLDGTMGRQERAVALDRFKTEAKTEVLLISLRAGGFGLNLVSACRAYLMDPYWNPAVENQALDRIHRWGQKKPVVMTKYVIRHTIEIAMLELQRRKMRLAETVGKRRALTAEEKKRERQEEYDLMMAETGEGADSGDEEEQEVVEGNGGETVATANSINAQARQVVEVIDDDDGDDDIMYMGTGIGNPF